VKPYQIAASELSRLHDAARANANQFNRPYVVFMDTSGKWRVESANGFSQGKPDNGTVFYPGHFTGVERASGRIVLSPRKV
jgi:hypothetical protein